MLTLTAQVTKYGKDGKPYSVLSNVLVTEEVVGNRTSLSFYSDDADLILRVENIERLCTFLFQSQGYLEIIRLQSEVDHLQEVNSNLRGFLEGGEL